MMDTMTKRLVDGRCEWSASSSTIFPDCNIQRVRIEGTRKAVLKKRSRTTLMTHLITSRNIGHPAELSDEYSTGTTLVV
jgi:hypothetical protein